jgi:tetratricopeptide (TPR) repeat protein
MAAEWKAKGNAALTGGNYDEAIDAYTKAIELDPNDHVFYSNRSAAYLSKGDAELALKDGEKCVELSPTWPKGHGRKGAALHALRRYDEATTAYNAGLAVAPDDAGLKGGLAEVHKAKTAKPAFGGGGGGGLFGPQLLSKLAGHPKFGPKLADPTFMTKLQMVQSNPQLLMSDPEMMEVLQVILGSNGGGAGGDGDNDDDQPFRPAPSSASSSSAPSAAAASKKAEPPQPPDEDLTEEEREAKKRKLEAVAAKERGNMLYKEKKFTEAIAAYDEAYKLDKNMMFLNNKAAVLIEMGQCVDAIALCHEAIEVRLFALLFPSCTLALSLCASPHRHWAWPPFCLLSQVGKAHRASFEDRAKVYQRIAAAHLKMGDPKVRHGHIPNTATLPWSFSTRAAALTPCLACSRCLVPRVFRPPLRRTTRRRWSSTTKPSSARSRTWSWKRRRRPSRTTSTPR